jgi:DNA-3-methyladenine glycosylase II
LTAQTTFVVDPIPPFNLDLTVWSLRRRPDNIIDRWDGQTYRRVLVKDGNPVEIAVTQSGKLGMPGLYVSVIGGVANSNIKEYAISAIERLLGIHVDLTAFYRFCDNDEDLRSLAHQFRGAKPPRFPTYFETLVNAIACQQLTLTVGIRLLNCLIEACGPAIETAEGLFHAFPGPWQLVNMNIEQLREMGFSYRKAGYLTGLARAVIEKKFDLEEIERLDDKQAVNRLCTLKGVGRWTAEYFLLRGLGRTHIFPGDDVGARNHLQRWLRLSTAMDYDGVHRKLRHWDAYGGLVYFHLLLKSLTEKGMIEKCKK